MNFAYNYKNGSSSGPKLIVSGGGGQSQGNLPKFTPFFV